MNIDERSKEGQDFWVGALMSVAIHGALVATLMVALLMDMGNEEEEEEEETSMEVVLEEAQPREPQEIDERLADLVEEQIDEEAEVVDEETVEEEEEEEEEQEEEELPVPVEEEEEEEEESEDTPDETPLDRVAVDQVTEGEEPEDADHISDEAHSTDEEMVAEITTLEDVEPTNDPEATEIDADTDLEMAMQTPEEFEGSDIVDPDMLEEPSDEEFDGIEESEEESEPEDESDADEEEREEQEAQELYRAPEELVTGEEPAEDAPQRDMETDREALFGRDMNRAREIFGEDGGEQTERSEEGSSGGRRLLARWKDNEEALRASLENFIPNVQPGNHTSVNAKAAAHASYLARIHRTIHAKWGHGFLPRVTENFPRSHELNDMSLETVVEIVIDAESGEVEEVVRIRPSGSEIFDAEAIMIAYDVGNHPDPPSEIVSHDGKVYIHWRFWRDARQCGTFGVRIFRLQDESDRRSVDPL